MRLVWDAIGRVDPNMILLIVRVLHQDKIQDGRVPEKREVLMYGNIHCTYDCTYSRFLFTRRLHNNPKEETTCVSG